MGAESEVALGGRPRTISVQACRIRLMCPMRHIRQSGTYDLSIAPGSIAIAPAVVDVGRVPATPVIVHVVTLAIAYSVAPREEVASIHPRAAPVHTPIPRVMAIHEHTAFPILISATPACVVTIEENVAPLFLTAASAASLG